MKAKKKEKSILKTVTKHLKGDRKMFKKESQEDKELMNEIKRRSKKKSK